MYSFRLYLHSDDGKTLGRQDFETATNEWALQIASEIADACSDTVDFFELWNGRQQIHRAKFRAIHDNFADLSPGVQRSIVDCGTALRTSAWPVASSARLAQRTIDWSEAMVRAGRAEQVGQSR